MFSQLINRIFKNFNISKKIIYTKQFIGSIRHRIHIILHLKVKNFGFTLDCHLTMNAHVSNIARTCYFNCAAWHLFIDS